MCLDAHLHLKELPCPFAVIWGDDWSVNLYKAIVLEEKKVNNKKNLKKLLLLIFYETPPLMFSPWNMSELLQWPHFVSSTGS